MKKMLYTFIRKGFYTNSIMVKNIDLKEKWGRGRPMKRLITKGIIVLIGILCTTLISFASSSDLTTSPGNIDVPSWDYEHNGNIPEYVDEDGNPIPNITINDEMTLVDVYGKWSQEAIVYCAKQGYLDGMFTRKYFFSPSAGIDKADLAILLGRMEKIEYSKYTKDYFSDIQSKNYDLSGSYDYSDWYRNYIPYYVNWAGEEEIFKGSGNGVLNNAEGFNREQAAAIIDRYIASKTSLYDGVKFDQNLSYKDQAQISSWAKDSVRRLSTIKLFKGDSNGFFNPKGDVTRAEVCQIIFNIERAESRQDI